MTNNSIKITGLIVTGLIILALIGTYLAIKITPEDYSNTVSSSGAGTIEAAPDNIKIYFTIQTKADNAKEAKDLNAEITDNALTNLIKAGFDRDEITTENFNLYPEYSWTSGQNKIIGYKATHSLKVEISADNKNLIGEAVDAGVDAGALINYINFELSPEKQNQYKAQALKQATEDAKNKAQAIAEGLGKELGKLVSVTDSSYDYYPYPLYTNSRLAEDYAGASEAKSAVTDIEPGKQTISARVSVLYKLK